MSTNAGVANAALAGARTFVTVVLAGMIVLLGLLAIYHSEAPETSLSFSATAMVNVSADTGAAPAVTADTNTLNSALASGCTILAACGAIAITALRLEASQPAVRLGDSEPLRESDRATAPVPAPPTPCVTILAVSRT